MGAEARVVQLQSSCGSLSIELYDNYCGDVFWQLFFGRVYSGIRTVEEMAKMQVDANFTLYTPVTTLKCSTAVLPKGTPPSAVAGASSAVDCRAASVSSVPLLTLLE